MPNCAIGWEMNAMRSWTKLVAALAILMGTGAVVAQDLAPSATQPQAKALAPAADSHAGKLAGAPLTQQDVDAWLDGYMPYAMEAGAIPGAVVVVVKDGQVLTER